MSQIYPLTLYYDAACPVCALEMDHLRVRDAGAGRLRFVDITAPGFDAQALGLNLEALHRQIHGRRADGQLISGVQVLRLAYEAAGLGWVLRPTAWAPLRGASELAYRLFARHRQRISRAAAPFIGCLRERRARQMALRVQACGDGACEQMANPRRPR